MKRSVLLFVLVVGAAAELRAQSPPEQRWRTALDSPEQLRQWRNALPEILTRPKTRTQPPGRVPVIRLRALLDAPGPGYREQRERFGPR